MQQQNTIGWTIREWQAAYQNQQIKLKDLKALVKTFTLQDSAWISIATSADLDAQFDALQSIPNAEQLPLYGIPIAIKDNIDVVGFVTTAACKALTNKARVDAKTVQRLKQAGAIVVGKTNLDQFATGLVGTRSPYGAVKNTFNPAYVSGGSSSGSASVVARGLVPIALGTDTAGSGRVPAAFNNIVGLKPTKGRFSNTGLIPACKSLDCISIFALTVEDAETVANIAEGYDPTDAYSRNNPNTAPAQFSPALKFAIPAQLNFHGDLLAEQAFDQAIATFKALNATITEIDFSIFEQLAAQLYQGPWVAERTAAVADVLGDLQGSQTDFIDPVVLDVVQQGHNFSAVDAYNAEYLKRDFIEFSGQRHDQLMLLENKIEEFKIPFEERYRYVPFERYVKELDSNVYKGYNTSMITDDLRFTSERLFEKYCEKNENVKYVYKNGDSGQQYLSIVYGTNFDKQRLFYPDYIVQLKDETIWLIETKGGEKQGQSKNIDLQIENKFEAFKQFANKHEYNFGFVRDKNDELFLNNTEYVDDMNDDSWVLIEEMF